MTKRQTLTKQADQVFSLHIRNRGATFEYNHCFTCGAYLPVYELQAGHFIGRRYIKVRWNPVNVWPQCNDCNVTKGGNLKVYEKKLSEMFSPELIDDLWELARQGDDFTDSDIKDIIKEYR